MRYKSLVVAMFLVAIPMQLCPGQATAPAKVNPWTAPDFVERQQGIATLLGSKNPDMITAGLVDLRKWFGEKPDSGEHALYMLRRAMPDHQDHAVEILEMVELGKKVMLASKTKKVGYLWAMQARLLADGGKTEEAMAAAKHAVSGTDRVLVGGEMLSAFPKALMAQKKYDVARDVLTTIIIAVPDDPGVVEGALKQRITVDVLLNKMPDALADAKRLYNVSTLEHAPDAVTLLDKQLKLANAADPAVVEKFHQEQQEGNTIPAASDKAKTSSVLLAIPTADAALDEALKGFGDTGFDDLLRHAALLLVADHPADALDKAQQAFVLATTDVQSKAGLAMIARCYKAQDGTTGRAAKWMADHATAN